MVLCLWFCAYVICFKATRKCFNTWVGLGATENAGVENAARAKMQGWKMRKWKMRE